MYYSPNETHMWTFDFKIWWETTVQRKWHRQLEMDSA